MQSHENLHLIDFIPTFTKAGQTKTLWLGGARGFSLDKPGKTSELVAQCNLYLARGIYDAPEVPACRCAKRVARDAAIQIAKDMAVEGVGYIHLEYQGVSLGDGGPFDNGKILAEVMVAADVAKPYGPISKDITALRHEAGSIRVHEGGAIEIVVRALAGEKPRLRIFNAPAGALRRVEGRFVRAVNRHARYATEHEVAATGLRGWDTTEEYGSR